MKHLRHLCRPPVNLQSPLDLALWYLLIAVAAFGIGTTSAYILAAIFGVF